MQPSTEQTNLASAKPVTFGIAAEVVLAAGLLLPHSTSQQILIFFVTQIPYGVTWLMLVRCARRDRGIRFWAIVASALGIAYAVLTGIAFLPIAFGLGFAYYPAKWIQVVSFLGLIPVNLYVAFAAAAVRKNTPTRRIAYPALKTIGAVILIVLGVWAHGKYDEYRMESQVNSQLDEQQVIEQMNIVLACLEEYKNSSAGYPERLAETSGMKGCSRLAANPREIPGYRFRYEPAEDAGNGKAASFRLEVRPPQTWFQRAYPYVADPTGIIYRRTKFGVHPIDSYGAYLLSQIQGCTRSIVNASHDQDMDSILQSLRNTCYTAAGEPWGDWEKQGATLVFRMTTARGYSIEMQLSESPGQVAMTTTGSARCTNYAMNCLRSYFMDKAGGVHGTAEPRLATVYDPLAPACESSSTPCDSAFVN